MPGTTSCRVHGRPAPQGSKDPWGGEANKRTKPWREQVAQALGEQWDGAPVLRDAVKVTVTFAFTRPKSHYRTGKNAHILREDAPYFHTAPNDTDKLCRAVGDALTGVVWADDKQVAWWDAKKIYDETAYADLAITDLSGGGDDSRRTDSAPEGSGASAPDPQRSGSSDSGAG